MNNKVMSLVSGESSNDNRNSFDLISLTEPSSSISLRSNGEAVSKAIERPTH